MYLGQLGREIRLTFLNKEMVKNQRDKSVLHRCGDCANITPVTEPRQLLSIDGKPTLGTCPYWTESRCTLLSWKSECEHFREKRLR